MKEIEYTAPLLVSGIFTVLLAGFFLYKSENKKVMSLLSTLFLRGRHRRAEIPRNTTGRDNVLFVILIILIVILGMKAVTFAVIISDSMKPEFQRGDLVLTQTMFKEPHVGDIVTFNAEDVRNTVTHRVIDIRNNNVRTKGDNNPLDDDYGTTKDDIIGKAITINGHPIVIKYVGSYFILDFSQTGKLYKYGDQYTFLQQMFATIRTWGYVITAIALLALIMSMGKKK